LLNEPLIADYLAFRPRNIVRGKKMEFYLLDRLPGKDGRVPLSTTEEHSGDIVVDCASCGTRGILPKCMCGKLPVDILVKDVGFLEDIEQAATVLLASRKFRQAVASAGLTGIEFYPPLGYRSPSKNQEFRRMIRRCREELQYAVIDVTGRGGSVALTSGLELRKSCDVCGWREWTLPEEGFYVDERQWDGSDFFHVEEYGPFFMTQRAVDVLSGAGLSNFGAELATECRPLRLGWR